MNMIGTTVQTIETQRLTRRRQQSYMPCLVPRMMMRGHMYLSTLMLNSLHNCMRRAKTIYMMLIILLRNGEGSARYITYFCKMEIQFILHIQYFWEMEIINTHILLRNGENHYYHYHYNYYKKSPPYGSIL